MRDRVRFGLSQASHRCRGSKSQQCYRQCKVLHREPPFGSYACLRGGLDVVMTGHLGTNATAELHRRNAGVECTYRRNRSRHERGRREARPSERQGNSAGPGLLRNGARTPTSPGNKPIPAPLDKDGKNREALQGSSPDQTSAACGVVPCVEIWWKIFHDSYVGAPATRSAWAFGACDQHVSRRSDQLDQAHSRARRSTCETTNASLQFSEFSGRTDPGPLESRSSRAKMQRRLGTRAFGGIFFISRAIASLDGSIAPVLPRAVRPMGLCASRMSRRQHTRR
jgi:hypothetical protein